MNNNHMARRKVLEDRINELERKRNNLIRLNATNDIKRNMAFPARIFAKDDLVISSEEFNSRLANIEKEISIIREELKAISEKESQVNSNTIDSDKDEFVLDDSNNVNELNEVYDEVQVNEPEILNDNISNDENLENSSNIDSNLNKKLYKDYVNEINELVEKANDVANKDDVFKMFERLDDIRSEIVGDGFISMNGREKLLYEITNARRKLFYEMGKIDGKSSNSSIDLASEEDVITNENISDIQETTIDNDENNNALEVVDVLDHDDVVRNNEEELEIGVIEELDAPVNENEEKGYEYYREKIKIFDKDAIFVDNKGSFYEQYNRLKSLSDEIKNNSNLSKNEIDDLFSMIDDVKNELLISYSMYGNDVDDNTRDELKKLDNEKFYDSFKGFYESNNVDSSDETEVSNLTEEEIDEDIINEDDTVEEKPIKVVAKRTWTWIKNNKKKILIALGITAITIAVVLALAELIPAINACLKAQQISSISNAMLNNSLSWHTASLANKSILHSTNEALAANLASIMGKTQLFSTSSGIWTFGGSTLSNVATTAMSSLATSLDKVLLISKSAGVLLASGVGLTGLGLISSKSKKTDDSEVLETIEGEIVSDDIEDEEEMIIDNTLVSEENNDIIDEIDEYFSAELLEEEMPSDEIESNLENEEEMSSNEIESNMEEDSERVVFSRPWLWVKDRKDAILKSLGLKKEKSEIYNNCLEALAVLNSELDECDINEFDINSFEEKLYNIYFVIFMGTTIDDEKERSLLRNQYRKLESKYIDIKSLIKKKGRV